MKREATQKNRKISMLSCRHRPISKDSDPFGYQRNTLDLAHFCIHHKTRQINMEYAFSETPSTELRLTSHGFTELRLTNANHTLWPIHIHNHFQSTRTSSFLLPIFSRSLWAFFSYLFRGLLTIRRKKSKRECSPRFVINKRQCKFAFLINFSSQAVSREFINTWDFDVFKWRLHSKHSLWWLNMLHLRVTFGIDLLMCDVFFEKILFCLVGGPLNRSFIHLLIVLEFYKTVIYGIMVFSVLFCCFFPLSVVYARYFMVLSKLKKSQKLTKRESYC